MPSVRPTLSTWSSWPSPTSSNSEVSGAKGSARLTELAASASGIIPGFRSAAGKVAIDETVGFALGLALGLLEDGLVQRRQRTGRIGVGGITGQRKGLAAAAAEIDLAEFATLARLLHPAGAAMAVEGLRVLPDPGDRMVGAHRFEVEPGDALGGVAGQHLAGRRDVEELAAPAAHALLRPQRVIIGHDIVDRQPALQPLARFFDDAVPLVELRHRRHQGVAFLQRPAVILDVGDLEPVGVEIDRHLDDIRQQMQVLPVHHRIHGERQIELARPFCDFELLAVSVFVTADAIGEGFFNALEADLDMAEPGIGKLAQPLARQQHGRGDEIGVEADIAGVLDQLDEVLARRGLAAGEMHLEHADLGEFAQDFFPFLGGQLLARAVELDRVGAIGTLQRAAMRDLEQHGERNAECLRRRAALLQHREAVAGVGRDGGITEHIAHDVFSRASVRKPLSARSCSMTMTSARIASRGAAYFAASWSETSPTLRSPSQSCKTSTAISSGASTRSGARITQTFRVSSYFSLACLGRTGRLVSLTLMLRGPAIVPQLAFWCSWGTNAPGGMWPST